MKNLKPSVPRPILVLSDFLSVDPGEIRDYGNTVYSWGETVYQVMTNVQMKEMGAPASHYVKYPFWGKTYRIREIGEKSSLYTKPFTDRI